MTFAGFLLIIAVSFAAELPDKTAIAAILLSRTNSALKTFTAAGTALTVQAFLSAYVGALIRNIINPTVVARVSSVILVLIALVLLFISFRVSEEDPEWKPTSWWKMFGLFFLAEFGDATQATTAGFALRFGTPLLVGLAAAIGLVSAQAASTKAGTVMRKIPKSLLYRIAAVLLLSLAVFTFVSGR